MSLKTLSELFPNVILGEGIFSEMTTAPWSNDITGSELDIMFFTEYGDRPISPLFKLIPTDNTGAVTLSGRKQIATLLEKRFRVPWKRRYSVLELDYNPLESMKFVTNGGENETIDFTDNTTDSRNSKSSSTLKKTGTDTTNDTITYDTVNSSQKSGDIKEVSESTETTNDNQNNLTYGFNSTEAVPTDKAQKTGNSTNNGTTTSTDTRKTEDTKTGTDKSNKTINYNTNDESSSTLTDTNTRNKQENTDRQKDYNSTKTGALGVFTNQDVLQKELDLWKYDYFKSVFDDIANILCLAIYQVDI